MAATKKRARSFPQADFEIPLADALAALMRAQDVDVGDQWLFHVDGDVLRITRARAPIEDPPEQAPITAPSRRNV